MKTKDQIEDQLKEIAGELLSRNRYDEVEEKVLRRSLAILMWVLD